jgi:putative addiction module component (TIGR02574 family)
MKREPAQILKDALALPTEARAALAGSLLESLDTEVDEDAEAAWATEVNRRVAELDSGRVKTVPWAEVRRRLAARWCLRSRSKSTRWSLTRLRPQRGGTATATRPQPRAFDASSIES